MTCPRILLLLLTLLVSPLTAQAQPASVRDGILGAWQLVSVVGQRDDGTRMDRFGPTPRGIIIFTADGHFSLFQSTSDVPRIGTSDTARATPEEAMGVVRSSIAYFGTYTVDEAKRELTVTLAGSTFANLLEGGPQRRIVTKLTATELGFDNPRTPSGLTLQTLWRRQPSP